ncbi:GNAT family N-acetyltransferase [Atopobacter phocae]|uniref:GNAT family N-acetyltransferase n=1 Tax=Atopobacter phocae TaxID=136492 RepID=UPI00047035C1|nr:GNAT family N-acetyltransferase [Atopobacter phocae]
MIETERLVLRKLKESDLDYIYAWDSDEEVTRFVTFPVHKSKKDTEKILDFWLSKYKAPDTIRFAIEIKESSEVMGMIDVIGITSEGYPEIGYASAKKYWGKGYMTEACKAMVNHMFEIGYRKILIKAMIENIGSNKVIEKTGFSFIKKEKVYLEKSDKNVTLNVYEINKA